MTDLTAAVAACLSKYPHQMPKRKLPVEKYSPDQPRDYHGRFADAGGAAPYTGMAGDEAVIQADFEDKAHAYADKVGYPKELVTVSMEDKQFPLNGTMHYYAGSADLKTGDITIFPKHLELNQVDGVMAHEVMHENFQKFLNEEGAQGKAAIDERPVGPSRPDPVMRADGTLKPPYDEKYPLYNEYAKLQLEQGSLVDMYDDGRVTPYAAEWWNAFHRGDADFSQAAHETLAEMAYLDQVGQLHPDYYRDFVPQFKEAGLALNLQYGHAGKADEYSLSKWGTEGKEPVDPSMLSPRLKATFDWLSANAVRQDKNLRSGSSSYVKPVTPSKDWVRLYDLVNANAHGVFNVKKYSPDQPRDDHGRFASAGLSGGTDFQRIAQAAIKEATKGRRFKAPSIAINNMNAAMRDAAKYNLLHWKDWYDAHKADVVELYGKENAELFRKFLAAGSIQQSPGPNLNESVQAMQHYLEGKRFDDGSFTHLNPKGEEKGTLGSRLDQYQAIADGGLPHGRKVGPFYEALGSGPKAEEAVPMDRWMQRVLFKTPGGSGSEAQAVVGKAVVGAMARELGWHPRQLQAVLWAVQLTRDEGEGKVYDYTGALHQRAKDINAFMAAHPGLKKYLIEIDVDVTKAIMEKSPIIDGKPLTMQEQAEAFANAAILMHFIDQIHQELGTDNPDPKDVADLLGLDVLKSDIGDDNANA